MPSEIKSQEQGYKAKKHSKNTNPKKRKKNWMLRFTGILAAATVIYMIFAGIQMCIMSGQLGEMKTTSKETKETKERQLRAYVYARPGNVFDVEVGHKVVVHTTIGNSGNTFAQNVKISANIRIDNKPGPDKIKNISSLMKQEYGTGTISPRNASGREIVRINQTPLDEKTCEQIRKDDGVKAIYVFGVIEYDDEFKVRHKTGFCHVYFGGYGGDTMFNKRFGYHAPYAKSCNNHNYAD